MRSIPFEVVSAQQVSDEWATLSDSFGDDGALRELHIENQDRSAWHTALDWLTRNREFELPTDAIFSTNQTDNYLLRIHSSLIFQCHFFIETDVELDF
jgi:hypothetical protein